MQPLQQSDLKKYLSYEKSTGVFTWIKSPCNGVSVGDTAGSLSNFGYVIISLFNKRYVAHRLAWLYVYGKFPNNQMDHINHCRCDNRIENLRDVTHRENSMNQTQRSSNSSGVTGVYWNNSTGKWRVKIQHKGKQVHLGYFFTMEAAVKCRQEANVEYGFHENHGVQ